MTQSEQEFKAATGHPAPERIWLIAMACGETSWNEHPDPNGDDEPSVGYVRADVLAALKAERDAAVAEAEAAKEMAAAFTKVAADEGRKNGITEGKRLATDTIVAFLRLFPVSCDEWFPDTIERGEHLDAQSPSKP